MNKTLGIIKANVGSEVQDTSASFSSLSVTYANKRYFQILRAKNWMQINDSYSFPTVAGQQKYALPSDFGKELYAYSAQSSKELTRMDLSEIAMQFPDSITASGVVERFTVLDETVLNQPTVAGAINVVSSSSADTTQTVLVRGVLSSGVEIVETLTLSGTSVRTTSNSFERIKAVSKSAATTGVISVTAGAVTIATLAPSILESRVKTAFLHYVPSSVFTIKMPYIIKPLPMANDGDYPILDIADLIEIGAKADALRYKKQFSKASVFDAMFEKELMEYVYDSENNPNQVTVFSPQTVNPASLY